jgi:competence protein ComEA
VDPSPAPWRAFETVEPDTPAGTPGMRSGPGPGGSASPTQPVPRIVLLGALAAILLLGAGAVALASGGTDPTIVVGSTIGGSIEPSPASAMLVVDVGGAVAKPGVYHLAPGSRISDAIVAAGGFGPRVDAARTSATLNLAAPLEDGEQIQVPSRDDPDAASGPPTGAGGLGGSGGGSSGVATGLVDLNRASQAELEALPGIGPVTAGKIIASREGTPFGAVQDLRDRKLVGQKTFDGLKDLVTVR